MTLFYFLPSPKQTQVGCGTGAGTKLIGIGYGHRVFMPSANVEVELAEHERGHGGAVANVIIRRLVQTVTPPSTLKQLGAG